MRFVQREYLFKIDNLVLSYGITCENGDISMGLSTFDYESFMKVLESGSDQFYDYIMSNGTSESESYDKKVFLKTLATINTDGEYIGCIDYASDNLKIMK